MKLEVQLVTPSGPQSRIIELERNSDRWKISLDGQPLDVDVVETAPNALSVLLDGQAFEFFITPSPAGALQLRAGHHEFSAEVADPRAWRGRRHGALEAHGLQQVVAPMPGKVVSVLVQLGDLVEAGQALLVVEAMKMQNEIRAPKSGKIERLLAIEGQAVNAGEVLACVE
ncbi:MAG TPA: biotin/lipoyl-containing protein [Candidatus Acidoferrum sp.]|nr:biotin/lipoyl-containing protein [Candidatus Acidoferrum sp.]